MIRAVPAPDADDEVVRVRRRQARAKETRACIIQAAKEEFARSGFSGTTTRAIALRAHLKHASVAYHFDGKLGVWQAVMREVLGSFHEAFASRLDGLHGVDDVTKLRLLQADFIRLSAAKPELHWLMSHEAGDGGERIAWLLQNVLIGDVNMFASLIRSAQKAGCYAPGDPLLLHYLFIGAAVRIFMVSGEVEAVMGRSPFSPEFVEEHIRTCQELFFRTPRRRGARSA